MPDTEAENVDRRVGARGRGDCTGTGRDATYSREDLRHMGYAEVAQSILTALFNAAICPAVNTKKMLSLT